MPHLNRAVNDPVLASSSYQAYSYQNPVVSELDLEKTLDLNRLHFSLDDFQKLSKGTYNAGELRLTSDGKLDIVNNHKTWTMFNHKSINGADSFAIRVAFAKAMEAGGVDEKAMHGIRKSLGLGDDNSMRTGKALEPLTRQEVRRLIDANITAINAHRAAGNKLSTYDQLHARYSDQEKKDIREVCETISRTGAGDIEINNELQDLIAVTQLNPSFDGLSDADAEYYLEFIDELSTALERIQDEDERYYWRRENQTEHKVTVTGGAIGMAIAIEGEKVVFETVNDGKRSRISLGLTPRQLQDRLDHSHTLLNEIAALEVNESFTIGKGGTVHSKKEPTGNSEQPSVKQLDDSLDESGLHEDIEIKEDPSPEARKRTAQQNLTTLASLMAKQYDIEPEVATDIIKAIEGWEDRLAECSDMGNPTRLADIDESLRDFLVENQETIQPLIDKAIADKA